MAVAEQTIAGPIDHRPMPRDKFGERLLVARGDKTPQEFGVPALGSGHAGLLSHRGL